MCKVLLIAGIKPETSENAWKFVEAMSRPMSAHNRDGLGYSAITADGKIFGERWLNNNEAFVDVEEIKKSREGLDEELFTELGDAVEGPKKTFTVGEYNSFGDVKREQAVAITLHTRMATSAKGMVNTHPFVKDGVSLIHNGIIKNPEDIGLEMSTCDSEAILQTYLQENVAADPANFQACADKLVGYYACGVLGNTGIGPTLDFFKGNHASLFSAKVKELDAFVISTNDDDIRNVCRELGYTMGEVYRIMEGRFIRLNAVTGKMHSVTKFTSGPTYVQAKTPSYNYPQTANSVTPTTSLGDTGKVGMGKVYPFEKNKKNTDIHPTFMNYFRGEARTYALSEREVQEEIMFHEREFGRYNA